MKRFDPCLSLLVLSEDASGDAHATLAALARKMLQILEPHCQTHRIDFEPASDKAAAAVRGTSWKTKGHRGRVDLLTTIATKLLEPGASGFVLFHVDGDRTWCDRATCENRRKFDEEIRFGVERVLIDRGVPEAARQAALARLALVMPFWSIEAWCYQNTDVAIRLCHEHHSGADVSRFQAWQQDRAALDDVPRPKDAVCLRDRHNRVLASQSFPADDVYLAGTSFAAAVDALAAIQDLRAALTRACA